MLLEAGVPDKGRHQNLIGRYIEREHQALSQMPCGGELENNHFQRKHWQELASTDVRGSRPHCSRPTSSENTGGIVLTQLAAAIKGHRGVHSRKATSWHLLAVQVSWLCKKA